MDLIDKVLAVQSVLDCRKDTKGVRTGLLGGRVMMVPGAWPGGGLRDSYGQLPCLAVSPLEAWGGVCAASFLCKIHASCFLVLKSHSLCCVCRAMHVSPGRDHVPPSQSPLEQAALWAPRALRTPSIPS